MPAVISNVNTLRLATLPSATAYHWAMSGQGRRAPDWEWEEIMLACDLVAQNGWQQLPAENHQVIELSELLQRMDIYPLEVRGDKFRNPNGVGCKTGDIVTAQPGYPGGRTNGGKRTAEVVQEFIDRPDVMHAMAESIRASAANGEPPDFPSDVGYDGESEAEGRYLREVIHRQAGNGRS
jgi:5-methylcytosine-specific restriction enzyme A